MENRNSLFSKEEHSRFKTKEIDFIYETKRERNPNNLFNFWREKKKLFDVRVSYRT